jgi:hypothetical protein
MLDKVKVHSYWWLKMTNTTLTLNYHRCWSSSFICLNIDYLFMFLLFIVTL